MLLDVCLIVNEWMHLPVRDRPFNISPPTDAVAPASRGGDLGSLVSLKPAIGGSLAKWPFPEPWGA